MVLFNKRLFSLLTCGVIILLPFCASAQRGGDTNALKYPIQDYRGDNIGGRNSNAFGLGNPSNFSDSVVYDPASKRYTIYQKIGNKYYRTPTTYNFDEYWALRNRQAENEYFQKRANTTSLLNRGKLSKPKLSLYDNFFNRLFGNGDIDITPQGFVDLNAGYQGQRTDNPTLPERSRKTGGLDFNMNAQVNVDATIGDKLKFPINYNTLANFNVDNQLKLDYTGGANDILKRFEAGNVSFPSRGTLIPGAQQLFGIKTQLQFGKLYMTAVVANQKSERQNVNFQGGSAAQNFELKADEYEENRHFLVGQYFRNNYDKVMSNLPAIISEVQILKMQVWVTNRIGTTTETRDVVGLADLGESAPFLTPPLVNVLNGQAVPTNNNNDLLIKIKNQTDFRNPALVFSNLTNLGLKPVQDFEKTFARKLDSTQYIFDRQVGTLSLNQPLQTDEVLGVAYQYSYRGRIFQVGEFSEDVPPDSSVATQRTIFLKLLKATSQRPQLPIWDLMMKNVYSVGYGTLSPGDFKLNVLYEEPGLGAKRYYPFGDKNQGTPIISLINLDRLNNNRDPQPDGVFDYVEGYTVVSDFSRIIFPVLEPFGRNLAAGAYNDTTIAGIQDTLFYALYDSIKARAQQFPNLNRFILKGSAKTTGSADYSIGYNIPRGSVTVTAGGRNLVESIDYDINYDLGTIRITNQAILNAGLPVQINFENNAGFGIQQRSYTALRLDYLAKNTAKQQLSLGATMVRLAERPFFTKVNLNEDPIRNSMYGADVNYRRDAPRITKLLNKLPNYKTTAPSSLNVYAEAAILKPGHAPQIGRGNGGVIYIDDFEGSKSGIDLKFPAINWTLASTPFGATDRFGNILFPEAALNNNLDYGKNRSKFAWYQIEQTLQTLRSANNPIRDLDVLSDPRMRAVFQREIFPQRSTNFGESQLITFDMAYYPTDRGPYNTDATTLSANGKLLNPKTRWGGLMRSLDQTDFETANIEFIDFWLQDPFINSTLNPNATASTGGKLYFNLGNISEDILKDGKRYYENGLPTPNAPAPVDETVWGRVPRNPVQVTNAFSNDPNERLFQDQGLDGLNDTAEVARRQLYLNLLQSNFGAGSKAYQDALDDPSTDNFKNYRDFPTGSTANILNRYKDYNSPQGNSPIDNGGQFINASTLYPDAEDLNRDNTLNETEEYFQYIVDIKPSNATEMSIGNNFIVDKKVVDIPLLDGTTRPETWYQFRIPISNYDRKIGNIPDFKSIRFIRMFATDFEDSVVMRFGQLQLARNIWRKFQYKIDSTGMFTAASGTTFDVGAVNIEENDRRNPLPYRTPRAIQRIQTQSNNGVNLLLNEQAMTLNFCGLTTNDAKGVFQTFANRDMRQFRKLQMYFHLEESVKVLNTFEDKDLVGIVRMGSDFVNNYYEIRIPLNKTSLGASTLNPETDEYNDTLWIPGNELNLTLSDLTSLKQKRNLAVGSTTGNIFSELQPNGQTYSVMGNPNLAEIQGILLGVENVRVEAACGEMWVNELRLSSIDERGGYAALARVDMNLADLGTISLSAAGHTNGFGTLEQKINERYRDDFIQLDAAVNLELGKLLPKETGIKIPVYAGYSQSISNPEYDPYDKDIKLKDNVRAADGKQKKDSIRNAAVDFTSTKTLNFTNVRKEKTNGKKAHIYDVENLDLSYSYIKTSNHSPLIEYNDVTRHRGVLGYNYTTNPKYVEPFKKLLGKKKSKWLDLVRDVNFNYKPSQISVRGDISRQFGVIRARSIGDDKYKIPETYDKYLVFQRDYIVRWDFTRSLKLDYAATNNSRVDEPAGRIDTKEKKDSVWSNLFKGGRNTLFNQTASLSYLLPTSKLPLLDWTTMNVRYQAGYRWIGASRLAVELGNILENDNQREATVQLDFNKLYQKSKWLRQLDQPQKIEDKEKWKNRWSKVTDSVTNKAGIKVARTKRVLDKTAVPYISTIPKIFGKLLTSIKQANLTYATVSNTRLPGYIDSTQAIGQNFRSMQPGFDFITGYQPDTNWLNKKARQGVITQDTNFNYLFTQRYDQRITASITLQPVTDLNITVDIRKTFNKDFSESFRFIDTSGGTNRSFQHLTPYATGGFDISFIAFKTMFEKFNPNQVSQTFKKFEANRIILSERLGKLNPYSQVQGADGYYKGYSKYAVDVLIPSFISAYTGQDPNKVGLIKQDNNATKTNPFRAIMPKPNWRIDYNGLSKIKGLQKIFTSVNITHAYNASLSMNGFTSALLYQDVSRFGYPSFIDTSSNNFIP